MSTILVVDGNLAVLSQVEQVFDVEGHDTLAAASAHQAMAIIKNEFPDLIILDMDLHDLDGIKLCRKLRGQPELAETPIIFLTNDHSPSVIAQALEAGGDDCIRKPFEGRELAARVRAHIRRAQYFADVPTISLVADTHQVFVNNREIELTRVEFDLLRYLCHAPYQWHSTSDLLKHVWQYPSGVGDAALVRNHIRNLRRKLEDNPDRPDIIQSRHGRGYFLKARIQFGVVPS